MYNKIDTVYDKEKDITTITVHYKGGSLVGTLKGNALSLYRESEIHRLKAKLIEELKYGSN